MAENPEISSDLLAKAAARAAGKPYMFAYVLARYAALNSLSDADLCAHLGCDALTLNRLRLCGRPDPDESAFAIDVQRIADKLGLDARLLASLVREVDAVEAFQSAPRAGTEKADGRRQKGQITPFSFTSGGMLKAARDRDEPEPPAPKAKRRRTNGAKRPHDRRRAADESGGADADEKRDDEGNEGKGE